MTCTRQRGGRFLMGVTRPRMDLVYPAVIQHNPMVCQHIENGLDRIIQIAPVVQFGLNPHEQGFSFLVP